MASDASEATTHKVTGKNHKMIEDMSKKLDFAKKAYVEKREKKIKYGQGQKWKDVEGDEVDLKKELTDDGPKRKPAIWEQWAGFVERGAPETLRLDRLPTRRTSKRAPGAGPLRKRDYKPIADAHFKNKQIILHTDGAKAYRLKVPGVWHDNVVHKAKKLKVKGKFIWVRPKYVKMYKHTMKDGTKVVVKCGTQIIDRFWSTARKYLKNRSFKVGSPRMIARIRAAQWSYWNKDKDIWKMTGELLQAV